MKRTILLSVMVFLLSIWKGSAQIEKKLEPDISSKSATSELLFLPDIFSFGVATAIELPVQEKKLGLQTLPNLVLGMLILNKTSPLSVIKFLDAPLCDFYKPDLFNQYAKLIY